MVIWSVTGPGLSALLVKSFELGRNEAGLPFAVMAML